MIEGGRAECPDEDAAALLSRVAEGDRASFAALFRLLAPRVKGYLIGLGTDPGAAEDLAQEVMLTIWRKAPQFDARRASPMTWAFVIARNRRIDALRRERSSVTYGQTPPETPDEAALADEALAGRDGDERMRVAVAKLNFDQQEVIRRSFFDEQPHAAIAQALGLPLGTVKSRLRLAFVKLRKNLEEHQ
jgi:RNA polymerase sigma-70 factor (ECF subfamily)